MASFILGIFVVLDSGSPETEKVGGWNAYTSVGIVRTHLRTSIGTPKMFRIHAEKMIKETKKAAEERIELYNLINS